MDMTTDTPKPGIDSVTAMQIEAACLSIGHPYTLRFVSKHDNRMVLIPERPRPRVKSLWLNSVPYIGTVRI